MENQAPVGSDINGEPLMFMNTEDAVSSLEARSEFQRLSFQEAIQQYNIVQANHDPVNGSYVILADKQDTAGTAFREMGYSSPSPWTAWTREEHVSALRDKKGIRTYYDMKRADGTIRGALRVLKTPIQAAEWFVKPATDSKIDQKIADFVADNLFNRLNVAWSRLMEDILTMCEYGYSAFEMVYKIDSDGFVRLRKLGHRHPLDVREWIYDDYGGPEYLVMEANEANGWHEIVIPIDKLVVFVFEQEGGDLRGTSILRSAYKHYYFKESLYKIDAIQKERHGIGVPLIKLPMGFTPEDRRLADELGRNLRTNERAHITAPMNWEISFAKLEGQPVNCLDSIRHHDLKIMSNVLAPFLDDPGSKAESQDMFYKSTRYIAATVADTINRHCIPKLVEMNFVRGNAPKLMVRRIGEWEDIRTMTFAARNLVGAKLLTPDEPLEAFIRDQLFLPPQDKETARQVETPQAPVEPSTGEPEVGMPRQGTKPPTGAPQRNAGSDRSGGN